jgi:serine/threonine protein kinase
MPSFPKSDSSIADRGNVIGNYRLVKRFHTRNGTVLQGVETETKRSVAIKVIDKEQVSDPGELECIYRDYRFTSSVMRHPNVAACLELLHSQCRVYLVFEDAGNSNLHQILSERPNHCLREEEALNWWEQLAQGVAHCHAQDVAHRRIALEHLVVSHQGEGKFKCKLVDFHDAMIVRTANGNRACGTLPCMAPEMVLGQLYAPILADRWSCGVVMLEAGGGLGSLDRAVNYSSKGQANAKAQLISDFFAEHSSHAKALASGDQVENKTMLAVLEQLMKPSPARRTSIQKVLSTNFAS